MTKEEILAAICKPACSSGEHLEDYENVLSPEKLAELLAKHL
jgi:hypothetical protein